MRNRTTGRSMERPCGLFLINNFVTKRISECSDEELAVRYSHGDTKAFDILLERSKTQLYAYILFIVRSHDVAEDIFQDTFVKAIVKMKNGGYSPTGKVSAWLTRIAHNVIMDRYRSIHDKNIVEVNEYNEIEKLEDGSFTLQPFETVFINRQTLCEVKELMNLLPPTQREVVFMRFFQNLSFREIAEVTGVSINTSLGRMRYAILNLRRMVRKNNINLDII